MSIAMPVIKQNPWRSAAVSLGFTAWTIAATIFGLAVADGEAGTPGQFLGWFHTHWWGALIGLIINPAPLYRAWQAIVNAQKGST